MESKMHKVKKMHDIQKDPSFRVLNGPITYILTKLYNTIATKVRFMFYDVQPSPKIFLQKCTG